MRKNGLTNFKRSNTLGPLCLRVLHRLHMLAQSYWAWGVGVIIVCTCAWALSTELPVLRAQNAGLGQGQTIANRMRPAISEGSAITSKVENRFGLFDRLSTIVGNIQDVAVANALTPLDASYKSIDDTSTNHIGQIEISVHLKGGYLPLKKTLTALLATHEGLALESCSLRRVRSTDTALDIELRFKFFYRKST